MNEEENIDKQSIDESQPSTENISDETIQHRTLNAQHNKENMEVHHPHHVTHKKKWGEYLLEFFMLFLAVFLGFVAENIREHSVERSKEKEYISSIYEDLKVDDVQLQSLIPKFQEKDKRLDTMLLKIKNVSSVNGANGIYKYVHEIANYPDFVYTDRTIQQLKNSGSMRLITNLDANKKIIGYDASVKMLNINTAEAITEQIHVIRQMNTKLFDLTCCPELGNDVSFDDSKIEYPDPGQLLTYDKNIIIEYYNNVQEMKRNYNIQRNILERLLNENIYLQKFLKN